MECMLNIMIWLFYFPWHTELFKAGVPNPWFMAKAAVCSPPGARPRSPIHACMGSKAHTWTTPPGPQKKKMLSTEPVPGVPKRLGNGHWFKALIPLISPLFYIVSTWIHHLNTDSNDKKTQDWRYETLNLIVSIQMKFKQSINKTTIILQSLAGCVISHHSHNPYNFVPKYEAKIGILEQGSHGSAQSQIKSICIKKSL